MKRSIKIFVGIIVLIVLIIAITNNFSTKNEGNIKIGVVGVLSGPAAFFGEDGLRGAQIAVDEINSNGGIDGREIELVSEDYAYEPKKTLPAYNLLKQKGVEQFIIQGSTAGSILAPEIVKDGNISYMSVETTPDYKDGSALTCRIAITADKFGVAIVEDIYNKNSNANIAILMNRNEAGESFRQSVKEKAAELGINIIADEGFEVGSGDYRTQIAKINSVGDENTVVVVNNVTNTVESMFNQFNELGMNYSVYADMWTVTNGNLKNKQLAEGVNYVDYKFDLSEGKAGAFADKFRERFGAEPGLNSVMSYDLVYIIVESLEEVGDTPQEISDYLVNGGQTFDGLSGEVKFDSDCEVDREFSIKEFSL
jgi:branched-chain amino acid transport system substrate-binding protein